MHYWSQNYHKMYDNFHTFDVNFDPIKAMQENGSFSPKENLINAQSPCTLNIVGRYGDQVG